jgi:hypothetical protein
MNCAGSVRLSEGVERQPPSIYAIEGTAAHEVATRCVEKDVDPELFMDTVIQTDDMEQPIRVDEDMVEAASVVRDYVNRRKEEGYEVIGVEQRFDLAALNPPAPMFGRADVVLFRDNVPLQKVHDGVRMPKPSYLDVIDLKYGRGHVVEAENNPQGLYYAVGAVLATKKRVDYIRITIIQPRAAHPDGIIREWECSWEDLVAFRGELIEKALATQDPNAPLNPGYWCEFCPALAVCPAKHADAQALAENTFQALVPVEEEAPVSFPVPEALPLERLQEVLAAAPGIEDWFKAIRDYMRTLTEAGEETGYKLVAKRGRRLWRDSADAERFLRARLGDEAFTRKLRSVTQAEKALKEAGLNKQEIEALWEMRSSGTNLVPDADPRPAFEPNTQAAALFEPVDIEPAVPAPEPDAELTEAWKKENDPREEGEAIEIGTMFQVVLPDQTIYVEAETQQEARQIARETLGVDRLPNHTEVSLAD